MTERKIFWAQVAIVVAAVAVAIGLMVLLDRVC